MRAEFQKNYLMRYAMLATVCLGMAAWFAYDGLIGYPRQAKYARAYEELSELQGAERIDQWRKLAAEKGWPAEVPDYTAEEKQDDIFGQYIWATLNLLVGLPALMLLLRSRGLWIESTPTGVKTSWGETLDFSEVIKLDKKKWADKGLAKATYVRHGRQRKFVFDDFKYERQPLAQMLRELESVLKPEQIIGGPPEAARDQSPTHQSPEEQGPHELSNPR